MVGDGLRTAVPRGRRSASKPTSGTPATVCGRAATVCGRAATVCGRAATFFTSGCGRMYQCLRPYASEAATLCTRGGDPIMLT
eukprot:scaffold44990_cov61-Phaeocystis_antarctica.AAC.1